MALFFCAACSSEGDDGEDESLVTANELSGTYWAGSVALGETTIPLTLNFTSTTDVTVGVTIAINRDVTCTYTISGNSIAATGTGDTWSGNNITFNVASYDGNTLKVTVASSSGEYFKLITAGTEIEFELSEVSTDENSTEE